MKKFKTFLALVILVSVVALLLTACGGKNNDNIIGTWERESKHISDVFDDVITFKSDGTYVSIDGKGVETTGVYKVRGSKELQLTQLNTVSYEYKIEGDTLTIYTRLSGESMSTYKKK